MSFRISNKKELERLVQKGMIKEGDVASATKALKASSKTTSSIELGFSPLPPVLPVDILYRALASEFGLWLEGGELVRELTAPFTKRRYALDMALPAYQIGIEMDGWEFHGKHLSDFKRDREKQLLFARYGWLLIRVSNDQIRNDLGGVVASVNECVTHRDKKVAKIEQNGFGRYKCMTNPSIFDIS